LRAIFRAQIEGRSRPESRLPTQSRGLVASPRLPILSCGLGSKRTPAPKTKVTPMPRRRRDRHADQNTTKTTTTKLCKNKENQCVHATRIVPLKRGAQVRFAITKESVLIVYSMRWRCTSLVYAKFLLPHLSSSGITRLRLACKLGWAHRRPLQFCPHTSRTTSGLARMASLQWPRASAPTCTWGFWLRSFQCWCLIVIKAGSRGKYTISRFSFVCVKKICI